jgi:hypothetical protein
MLEGGRCTWPCRDSSCSGVTTEMLSSWSPGPKLSHEITICSSEGAAARQQGTGLLQAPPSSRREPGKGVRASEAPAAFSLRRQLACGSCVTFLLT